MEALIQQLSRDYPELKFRFGKKFAFLPPCTITVGPVEPSDSLLLLHEVGHALSLHRDFDTDAKRLKMEREAWEKARELCKKYGVNYDEEVVEQELDSYRNWLDKKSRCPICGLTRFQTSDKVYHCPRCDRY